MYLHASVQNNKFAGDKKLNLLNNRDYNNWSICKFN